MAGTLWCCVFIALALVPDQKILRWKLLALEAGVLSLLAWTVGNWLSAARARVLRTPIDRFILLYAAGGVLFYALSPERGVSRMELDRILFCAASFFAASQTWPLLKDPKSGLRAFALPAAALALYALLQLRGGLWLLLVPKLDRPEATFGNPIFLAAYLNAALIAALSLAQDEETPALRALAAASAALLAAGLWSAQSRSALAGLACAAVCAVFLRLHRRPCAAPADGLSRARTVAAQTAALAGVALAAAAAARHFRGRQWTHGLIWKDTLALWLAHPWLGCGLGRFHVEFPAHASQALRALWPEQKVIINFAHNEYLQVLAETGALGLLLFLAPILAAARLALRPAREATPDAASRKSPGNDPRQKFADARGLPQAASSDAFLLVCAGLLGQAFFSPDLRFGISGFLLFTFLGAAAAALGGRWKELSGFARPAATALAAAALAGWASSIAGPVLARRRLAGQPDFHTDPSKELERSIAALEERLAAHPGDGDAAENLGWLYAKERRWPQAVDRYLLAAKLLPDRPGPLNNLGNIHYSLGRRADAVACWKRSLSIAPDQLDAHLNLGKALYEIGRLKEAAEHLQAALRRDPGNEKALILLKKMVE